MVRWGFVIDQTACIGCHACTVACKSENNVPVGAFRTWVKYIEKGQFPDVRRHFAVLRCNQCEDSPCTEICPTVALFRRSDGIVDFDNSRCIGCKSCMQACPYDALYIDPTTNTAAKCNYCVHRAEESLEPACAVVCPERAIIAGDLDDPTSAISLTLARKAAAVRKPEKGTRPKVFYVGADQAALDPNLADRSNPAAFSDHRPSDVPFEDASARVIHDVDHPGPWGIKVAAYLWTKSIAAGIMMLTPFMGEGELTQYIAPIIALFFLAVTAGLLIFDLKRPDRFYYLMIKPNFRSWLVLGGFILTLFGAAISLQLLLGVFKVQHWMFIPSIVLGIAAAGYSAFLFNQCDGRELWQGPMLFMHLLAAAVMAGGAFFYRSEIVAVACAAAALVIFIDFVTHRSAAGRKAVRVMLRYPTFWPVVAVIGHAVPILAAILWTATGEEVFNRVASISALLGLFEYERLWIKAGQAVPIS
jgi:Fe-S-cluster-containing dehydrogenase component/formate-dependent nitrite reductase membrane component NrfD